MPARVQEQLIPQRAGQPAGAPLSRPLQSQSAETDLNDVAVQFRSLAIFWKDGYLLWGRRALIDHVNRSTPGGPLAIVNLAKIQHLALYNAIPLAPPILDDAPVAVFLAVLAADLGSQKHVPSLSIYAGRSRGKVGTTSGFGEFSTVATREINQLGDVIPVKKYFWGRVAKVGLARLHLRPTSGVAPH